MSIVICIYIGFKLVFTLTCMYTCECLSVNCFPLNFATVSPFSYFSISSMHKEVDLCLTNSTSLCGNATASFSRCEVWKISAEDGVSSVIFWPALWRAKEGR